jgi:aspartate racemase
MKKFNSLGILGLGSFSTLFYIEELNCMYQAKMKGYNTFPFKMLNVNFDAINRLLPDPSKQLKDLVQQSINELTDLKVDVILVPNITLHETIDKLNLTVEIIHPLACTLDEIQKNSCKKIVLIASSYSMNSTYISSHFTKNEIEVILPSENEMLFIDTVRKEVYENKASAENLEKYNSLIEKYAEKSAVVIACTELSLAFKSTKELEIYDMSRIQILEAIKSFVQ